MNAQESKSWKLRNGFFLKLQQMNSIRAAYLGNLTAQFENDSKV